MVSGIKVRIENFLSLRSIEISFGKLNVLVGPNASGKSNVARAFQIIQNMVFKGAPMLEGYSYESLHHLFDTTKSVMLRIEWGSNYGNLAFELTIGGGRYAERAYLNGNLILQHYGDASRFEYASKDGQQLLSAHLPVALITWGEVREFYHRDIYPSVFHSSTLPEDAHKAVYEVRKFVGGVRVYSFNPQSLRLSSKVDAEPFMHYHGENLARYLLHLYLERRRDFEKIESVLRGLVPEVEEIVPRLRGSVVEIWLRVRGFEEPLPPSNVSDGTLRLLALATAFYEGSSVLVLEEPENCIHPHLLEAVIDLARKASGVTIITTHSPYLLDHVKPEEVYVVSKTGFETKVVRLSDTKEVENVKRFLEHGGTLGEAWYSKLFS